MLVPVEDNPIDAIWTDRPQPPLGAVVPHDLRYAGEATADKLKRLHAEMEKISADALVVSDPQNVSWLFNIRGSDVPHTPVVLAFAMVPKEGRPALYVDLRKLGNGACPPRGDRRCCAPAPLSSAISPTSARSIAPPGSIPATCAGAIAGFVVENGGDRARQRSNRADEGGEERNRDRWRPRGATARRRGGDEIFGLVRPRAPAANGDRRRLGAGEFPPRQRPLEGRYVPDHCRRWAGRRFIVHYRVTRKSNRRIAPRANCS